MYLDFLGLHPEVLYIVYCVNGRKLRMDPDGPLEPPPQNKTKNTMPIHVQPALPAVDHTDLAADLHLLQRPL